MSLTLDGMPTPEPRRRVAALVLMAAALAAVTVLAAWQPWVRPSAPLAAGSAPVTVDQPAPLALPEHARVLVFGDSWTYGSAATLPTEGYAYVLGALAGFETTVLGVRGSGYLRAGLDGPDFGTRIAALDPALDPDLVIIQGSINDRTLGAPGYRDAVNAAWDALAAIYPDARIVVLGPAPHVLPVGKGTARIDRDLRALAAARGWWYISPVTEQWITPENYADVIDTGIGRNHPSSAGHIYLAERVAHALAERGAAADAGIAVSSDASE